MKVEDKCMVDTYVEVEDKVVEVEDKVMDMTHYR